MRTTLDIDPDLLQLAKELASRERTNAGAVISKLARAGFHAATAGEAGRSMRNGMEILPSRGEVVTLDHVNRLLDDEGG
jgi:hypothetical protein